MYSVNEQVYGPILREKQGELRAAMDLHPQAKRLMLPTWVALPLTAKENASLSVTDVMKREVGRVQSAWGGNVCLWDPRFLEFDPETEVDGRHLEHVLNQFAVFGCQIIPVASLREGFARLSVMANFSKNQGSGLAIRIEFNDLGDFEVLDTLMQSVRLLPKDCVLLIDLTEADTSQHDEFAAFLVEAIDGLASRGNWARIITAASSYPFKNPAPSEGEADAVRAEWKVWDWALKLNPDLHRSVVYGDFGADNATFSFTGGGIPIPHLRYALKDAWRIVRGSKQHASLQGVAKRIADAKTFFGRSFSAGDEFIADCATGAAPIGDASRWRAANMNHHFMVVITELAARYGLSLEPRVAKSTEQVSLF